MEMRFRISPSAFFQGKAGADYGGLDVLNVKLILISLDSDR